MLSLLTHHYLALQNVGIQPFFKRLNLARPLGSISDRENYGLHLL